MTGTDLIVPVTGELVPADAPREKLAELVAWIDGVVGDLGSLRANALDYLLTRLDEAVSSGTEESWTQRFDGFTVVGTPPGDTLEYGDAETLWRALRDQVSVQVAQRAVKRTVKVSYSVQKRQIERLKQAGGKPAEVIAQHERKLPKTRKASVEKQAA